MFAVVHVQRGYERIAVSTQASDTRTLILFALISGVFHEHRSHDPTGEIDPLDERIDDSNRKTEDLSQRHEPEV